MTIVKDIKTAKSEQEVENLSFDIEFNINVAELLGYVSATEILTRVAVDTNGYLKVTI